MQLHVHSQDRPHRRPDGNRREMAGAGLAGLQTSMSGRGGRDSCSQHLEEALNAPVRPGSGPRVDDRARVSRSGGSPGEMMPRVLPRGPRGRSPQICARPRPAAVRGAVRTQAPPSGELAQLAPGVELQDAQTPSHGALDLARACTRAGRTSSRAYARRAPWRRFAPVGCGTAPAAPGGKDARTAAGPGSPASSSSARRPQKAIAPGPAGKKATWDPRRPDQVPGPGPAQIRHAPGRGRRAARRPSPGRALRSQFEAGRLPWKPPEPRPRSPRSLLRADGRSIYQRHGGTRLRHARRQLTLEERMLAPRRPRPAARRAWTARARRARRPRRGTLAPARGRAGRAARRTDAPDACQRPQDAQGAARAAPRTRAPGLREDQARRRAIGPDRRPAASR